MDDAKTVLAQHFCKALGSCECASPAQCYETEIHVENMGAFLRGADAAGFAIVPKQLPESAIHAGNLDAEDSDQYEVLVEHCRVKP